MPRPKESNPRSQWLTIRLTPEEATALRRRAERAGVSVSRYGRVAVLGAVLPERNAELEPESLSAAPEAVTDPGGERRLLAEQLRRVGVNLNQIARQLNTNGFNSPRDLLDLLADIRGYMEQARQA